MQKTKIEYLDYSWNPIGMKCDPVSEGCLHCWHLETVNRFGLQSPGLREKELVSPLRLKKPSKIGVQFMGDLFHPSVPFGRIEKVMAVIEDCPEHIFQVLTKRPEIMANYFNGLGKRFELSCCSNLWLGVTCENQRTADERIPILLQIPAAVRFLSLEPLLEDINFEYPKISSYEAEAFSTYGCPDWFKPLKGIDWIITGCESGPKRRPCKLEWVRNIRDQCRAANVPLFVKQLSINGKVSHDPNEWPEDLRIREYPK